MAQPNTKVRNDVVPTRGLQSREENKTHIIRMSRLTNIWSPNGIKYLKSGLSQMDWRSSAAILKSRENTDSGGITHNVHIWGKGNEQTWFSLKAELESYFPWEMQGCAAPIPCSSECFQEVNLGTSAHHKTAFSRRGDSEASGTSE